MTINPIKKLIKISTKLLFGQGFDNRETSGKEDLGSGSGSLSLSRTYIVLIFFCLSIKHGGCI